jgi:hypothetical protein
MAQTRLPVRKIREVLRLIDARLKLTNRSIFIEQ